MSRTAFHLWLASGLLAVGSLLPLASTVRAQEEPKAKPAPAEGVRSEPREGAPEGPRRGPRGDEFDKGPKGQPGRGPGIRPGVEGRGPDGRGPEGRPGEPPTRRPGAGGPEGGPDGRGPGFGPRGGGFPGGPFGPGAGGPQDVRRMQQEDPEMYELLVSDSELDGQALEISEQLRRAPSDQREKLQTALKETVNKHFEVRQQRRELQLKRMENEIKRLRDAIKARSDAREEIVNKRITELTGDANPLDF